MNQKRYSIKELIYFFFVRLPFYLIGGLRGNRVRVHWGRGQGKMHNFGDCLQPYTLKHYGLTPYFVTSLDKADVIMAGSILQNLSPQYAGHIIGAGGSDRRYAFPAARVLAVRGLRTMENIVGVESCILGDAGLVMPFVFPEPEKKLYDLGVIPHFVDARNGKLVRLGNFPGVTMIDVFLPPPVSLGA